MTPEEYKKPRSFTPSLSLYSDRLAFWRFNINSAKDQFMREGFERDYVKLEALVDLIINQIDAINNIMSLEEYAIVQVRHNHINSALSEYQEIFRRSTAPGLAWLRRSIIVQRLLDLPKFENLYTKEARLSFSVRRNKESKRRGIVKRRRETMGKTTTKGGRIARNRKLTKKKRN
jgi:hypothetical protein